MDKAQKKHLSAVRKLLGSKTWDEVAQGIALVTSLDDPEVMKAVVQGLKLQKKQRLVLDGDLKRRVKTAHRSDAALALAVASGLLKRVRHLDLGALEGLTRLAPLQELPKLESVCLTGIAVPPLGPLASVPGLTGLDLSTDPDQKVILGGRAHLPTLAQVRQLTHVQLRGCGLRDLSLLADMTNLVDADVSNNVLMASLQGVPIANLQRLNLNGNTRLTQVGPLAGAPRLQQLDLQGCSGVEDLAGLDGLPLTHLNLWGTYALQDLGPLAGLAQLHTLSLRSALKVSDLSPLAGRTTLRDLDIGACHRVESLAPLADLVHLERLEAFGCPNVDGSVDALSGLTALTHLSLSGLTDVDLSPLAGLQNLQSLSLQTMKGTLDLGPLAGLGNLKTLNLYGCETVVGAEALEHVEIT